MIENGSCLMGKPMISNGPEVSQLWETMSYASIMSMADFYSMGFIEDPQTVMSAATQQWRSPSYTLVYKPY